MLKLNVLFFTLIVLVAISVIAIDINYINNSKFTVKFTVEAQGPYVTEPVFKESRTIGPKETLPEKLPVGDYILFFINVSHPTEILETFVISQNVHIIDVTFKDSLDGVSVSIKGKRQV